ncbi:BTB/POZ domain-containing protein At5g48130 [Selaginella moellendorffii]|nr:BTB/POZ domain-containing protein At5g48130 [Selaginella moellendorffii]|eukprot:XP_002970702.2 BTB/POZ domain-containing protein At5g48130 [Selaginella moellendorffii]
METIHEVCEESSSQAGDEDNLPSVDFGARRSAMENSSCSRCKALGSLQFFKVYAGHSHLAFHKCLLASKSGYLSRVLKNSSRFKLPMDFPGGMEVFEAVVGLCESNTGSRTNAATKNPLLEPSNVAILHCAAEYLEMNSGAGSLCETTSFHLNQALTSWSDSIQVLSSCYSGQPELLQLAEELFIVQRCVESLASMVCSEFEQSWIMGSSRVTARSKLWIKDLMRMPFRIFSRIIVSCTKQGLSPKNTSQLVVKYAEKWLFSESCCSDFDENDEQRSLTDELLQEMLDCIAHLLPFERGAVPISFLFALLRYSVAIDAPRDCRVQIESRIACQLDLATIEDLLMPFKSARQAPTLLCELDSMKHVVALFMAQCRAVDSSTGLANWEPIANVARVWDEYLTEIGYSGSITPTKFAELIDAVPGFVRVSHDQLYKAIHVFLKAHPTASQSERSAICRPLDCQKLSQEVCIHAVQNELMPLRTIVQAMFVQQHHTRREMDHQFTRGPTRSTKNKGVDHLDLYEHHQAEGGCEEILPFLASLKRERDDHDLKANLEVTNSKLESLEQQLLMIRRALEESSHIPAAAAAERSSSGGVGRKISKAIHKVGLLSGLCKGNPQMIVAMNPAERCFPNRSIIHPEDYHLLGGESIAQAPPRRSTSSRDDAATAAASNPLAKNAQSTARRHSHSHSSQSSRYSTS